MRQKRILGKFLRICIIILIPLLIPISGYAITSGKISKVEAKGSAGILNIISNTDNIEFTVTASISVDGVPDTDLNENLFLGDPDSAQQPGQTLIVGTFTCIVGNNECKITYPPTDKAEFKEKYKKFMIYLREDNKKDNIEIQEIKLWVDNSAPRVTNFWISNTKDFDFDGKKYSSTGKINLNFDAEDLGFNGDENKCAGLKSIEFYLDTGTEKLLECTGECIVNTGCKIPDKTTTMEYTHEGVGVVKICAKAIDKLDKQSSEEKCDTFIIDKESPKINLASKKITDLSDKLITNIAPEKPVQAKFSIDIEGLDIDTSSITADISELNENKKEDENKKEELKEKKPAEIIENKDYKAIKTFVWEFELNLKSEGTKKIQISGADFFGNKIDTVAGKIEIIFGKDELGPVITSIKTEIEKTYENKYYAGVSENFIVNIEDATGVSKEGILLHIKQGSIEEIFKPKECIGDKIFTCKWVDVGLVDFDDEREITVFIDTDSKDILGNPVKEKKELKLILDKTNPKVEDVKKNINVVPVPTGVDVPDIRDIIKTGDSLEITIDVVDISKVSVTADLTEILIQNAENVDIPCENKREKGEPNKWICKIRTSPIDKTIDKTGIFNEVENKRELRFTIKDIAGNKLDEKKEITVLRTEEQPPEDFFKLNTLDDKVLPIEIATLESMARDEYQLIIPISIAGVSTKTNCQVLEIINERLDCAELPKNEVVLNKKKLPYLGYVDFFITADNIPAGSDKLPIGASGSCVLSYNIKCDDTYYKVPERHELKLNVYVNREVYTNVEGIEDDIEEIKDYVNGDWKYLVDKLDKLSNFAQNICNIKHGVSTLLNGIAVVGALAGGCVDSRILDVASGGTCTKADQTLRKIFSFQSGTYEKIIKYIDLGCGYAKCAGTEGISKDIDPDSYKSTGDTTLDFWKGGGLCDTLRKELADSTQGDGVTVPHIKYFVGERSYLSQLPPTLELAKKNWFIAVGCGCIPGIIANLQKYRQIQCEKGICLRDVMVTGMVTKDDCDKNYGYARCKYIAGGVGGVLGLFALGSQNTNLMFYGNADILIAPLKAVSNMLENPIASGWTKVRQEFKKWCSTVTSDASATIRWSRCGIYSGMVATEYLLQYSQVKSALENIKDFKSSIQPDYCEVLSQELGEEEPENPPEDE